MKTITLNVPEDLEQDEAAIILASQLYQQGKVSAGQAAELVGLSKEDFIVLLSKYGVSVFSESTQDFEQDIVSLKKFLDGNR